MIRMERPFNHYCRNPGLKVWTVVWVVLLTALGLVYAKHKEREVHIRLQELREERDRLHVEWTQLLLERGALGADMRVERIAREELGMVVPPEKEIVIIKP